MKTALLLVDFQNDYFPGGKMELHDIALVADAAARLLAAFRSRFWPVLHVIHHSTRLGASFFLPGTTGAEIWSELAPLPGEPVIIKHFPNTFRKTDLLKQLQDARVGNVLACGMISHICVDATVRAAFDLGFACHIVHDACGTTEFSFNGVTVPVNFAHASYMASAGVYARVVGSSEIIAAMATAEGADALSFAR